MDFFGIFQWLFGLGADHRNRVADKKNEIAKLSAEMSAEVGRVEDIMALEHRRLRVRCDELFPDDTAIKEACLSSLGQLKAANDQLRGLVDSNRRFLDKASTLSDWDTILRNYLEWRGTASRLVPWAEGVVKQLHEVLDGEERRRALAGG
ncbi:MAG TPA: hypothetical protein VN036_01930 [Devosia sp.]|nr:hypothetical protein [Devosia sp.]